MARDVPYLNAVKQRYADVLCLIAVARNSSTTLSEIFGRGRDHFIATNGQRRFYKLTPKANRRFEVSLIPVVDLRDYFKGIFTVNTHSVQAAYVVCVRVKDRY